MKYLQSILWFILSLIISCGNDTITKYIGQSLDPWEITFFRFAFAILTLLPAMLYHGKKAFITHRWKLHAGRGVLIFAAISLWAQGVKVSPITTATLMSFSVPLFVLLLAPIILQERVAWPIWVATLGGFIGVLMVLSPDLQALNHDSWLFVLAAMLFASLDVLNKKYVNQESILGMLFYANVVALVLVTFPTIRIWHSPSSTELGWLIALGAGGNLILYCLLRAFALTSASSLAPFRYLELLISMGVGHLFFHELPTAYSYAGAAVIIPCTLFIGYYEASRVTKSHQ